MMSERENPDSIVLIRVNIFSSSKIFFSHLSKVSHLTAHTLHWMVSILNYPLFFFSQPLQSEGKWIMATDSKERIFPTPGCGEVM